ncbi:MAG: response regulator [Anaerolineae bacterium]|jgi:DNA-binding response OmpR family regulator|nr:response regulator [Anaerolineae bacterium]MBT7074609.1 response regulator [Anaerolineae bacterium]MBT7782720.1 response regulator [Anaerolineae bacterium]
MPKERELILLIENDPDISDIIVRQALQPLRYRVKVVTDANKAIQAAMKYSPDLVIADLNSPGLSGKDLLVAFGAQNFDFPVIILAAKEQEREVMQTLRLGAADYLLWPAQATEVVTVVENSLKLTRGVNDRRKLDRRLRKSDQELAHKTHELRTILAIGKAVVSISDQRILFDRIVEGAMHVASADIGWLLLRDEKKRKSYLLTAQRNLPTSWAKKMNKHLDDGVSSLVALSGETLAINGNPLKRFKLSALGKSAAVVPIKARDEVVGLLVIVRKKDIPIMQNEEALLEAVSDYASISLVNARLFRALQESANTSHSGEKRQDALWEALRGTLYEELRTASFSIDLITNEKLGHLNKGQRQALETAQAALERLQKTAEQTIPVKK